jgi:hypothetical protein
MGCLSGLVSITGGCGYVQSWASIIIGLISGLVYLAGSHLIILLGVDDAVDAVSISWDAFQHMINAANLIALHHHRNCCQNRFQSTCCVECGAVSA